MTSYRIALIPGDGIGREVVPAALSVLESVGKRHGITFGYDEFGWSTTGSRWPSGGGAT